MWGTGQLIGAIFLKVLEPWHGGARWQGSPGQPKRPQKYLNMKCIVMCTRFAGSGPRRRPPEAGRR
jgi:hypothetical protein